MPLGVYTIRVRGRLGATARSAFPAMVCEHTSGETVLTGSVEDRSALYGVLAQIEALGLELLEVRQVAAEMACGDERGAELISDEHDDIPR